MSQQLQHWRACRPSPGILLALQRPLGFHVPNTACKPAPRSTHAFLSPACLSHTPCLPLLFDSCSDPHLQFVEEVALPPPEVQIDLAEQERNERELAEAVNAPLPADDDDELID